MKRNETFIFIDLLHERFSRDPTLTVMLSKECCHSPHALSKRDIVFVELMVSFYKDTYVQYIERT